MIFDKWTPDFLFSPQLSDRARERKVPATRISRLVNFGGTNSFHLLFSCTHTQSFVMFIEWIRILSNYADFMYICDIKCLHCVLFQVSLDTFEILLNTS